MQFPNEHNLVLQTVSRETKLKRVNNDFGKGIDSIYSMNNDGSNNELVSIRFRKNQWSTNEINSFISDKKFKGELFQCDDLNTDSMAFDSVEIIGKMKKTQEGYYTGKAVVTKVGVYKYINLDGTIRREFKSPESAFEKDSLESLKMKPITNDHPGKREVNIDNAKELQSGMTGEVVGHDNKKLWVSLTVTDKNAVDAIDSGKRQLSLGYKLKRIPEKGVFEGQEYDIVQKNIRYNHLAIVNRARCGKDICLNVDSWNIDHLDSVLLEDENNNNNDNNNPPQRKVLNMEKITINGINYDAAPEVVNYVREKEKISSELNGDIIKLKKNGEELKAKFDTANDELQKIKKSLPEMIGKRVQEKVELLNVANDYLSEEEKKGIDSLSAIDIKKKIILSRFPNTKEKINNDSTSDDYINARYEATIEILEEDKKNNPHKKIADQRKKFFNNDSNNNNDNDENKVFTYEDEMKLKRNAWRGKSK